MNLEEPKELVARAKAAGWELVPGYMNGGSRGCLLGFLAHEVGVDDRRDAWVWATRTFGLDTVMEISYGFDRSWPVTTPEGLWAQKVRACLSM